MTNSVTTPNVSSPLKAVGIPWFGLVAVLMGTFISTLNGRLSNFGLADIRGSLGAGFDEGAWITTAQAVGQMLIAPLAVWAGATFGPRRCLIGAASAFAGISSIIPLSRDVPTLLTLQFASGLASGFFIPLTLSFILPNSPPKFWAFALALYALNLELSLNIAASLEGWYVEHLSWHWIFWQNIPFAVLMGLCLRFGVVRDPIKSMRPPADIFGMTFAGVGLALIYAGLDQGNRLDWSSSGTVVGLLASGALLFAAFFLHEARTPHPLINLKVALGRPIPGILLLIGFLRLTILATSFLIPQYLQVVRGFRALEVGHTLLWIAAPQFVLCPIVALLLRRVDSRLIACIGFVLISIACLLVAHTLTPDWGSNEFLVSQLLQAVGQSFALSGVLLFGILHLNPQEAATFGAAVQTARLMGGEIGLAFVTTLTRVRGQTASNLIGLHVQSGDEAADERLRMYGALVSRAGSDPAIASARAAAMLGGVVRRMASMQGIVDAFVVVGALTAVALVLAAAHRSAPRGPASHLPLFGQAP